MEGVLYKKGSGLLGKWQSRLFKIRNFHLEYYTGSSADEAKDSYDLRGCISLSPMHNDKDFGFSLKLLDRKLALRAPTAKEKAKWLGLLSVFDGHSDAEGNIKHLIPIADVLQTGMVSCIEYLTNYAASSPNVLTRPKKRNFGTRANKLFAQILLGKCNIPMGTNLKAVSECLMKLLKDLPETLLTNHLFADFNAPNLKLEEVVQCVKELPAANRTVLHKLCVFLEMLCIDMVQESQTTIQSAALTYAPYFCMKTKPDEPVDLLNAFALMTQNINIVFVSEKAENNQWNTEQEEVGPMAEHVDEEVMEMSMDGIGAETTDAAKVKAAAREEARAKEEKEERVRRANMQKRMSKPVLDLSQPMAKQFTIPEPVPEPQQEETEEEDVDEFDLGFESEDENDSKTEKERQKEELRKRIAEVRQEEADAVSHDDMSINNDDTSTARSMADDSNIPATVRKRRPLAVHKEVDEDSAEPGSFSKTKLDLGFDEDDDDPFSSFSESVAFDGDVKSLSDKSPRKKPVVAEKKPAPSTKDSDDSLFTNDSVAVSDHQMTHTETDLDTQTFFDEEADDDVFTNNSSTFVTANAADERAATKAKTNTNAEVPAEKSTVKTEKQQSPPAFTAKPDTQPDAEEGGSFAGWDEDEEDDDTTETKETKETERVNTTPLAKKGRPVPAAAAAAAKNSDDSDLFTARSDVQLTEQTELSAIHGDQDTATSGSVSTARGGETPVMDRTKRLPVPAQVKASATSNNNSTNKKPSYKANSSGDDSLFTAKSSRDSGTLDFTDHSLTFGDVSSDDSTVEDVMSSVGGDPTAHQFDWEKPSQSHEAAATPVRKPEGKKDARPKSAFALQMEMPGIDFEELQREDDGPPTPQADNQDLHTQNSFLSDWDDTDTDGSKKPPAPKTITASAVFGARPEPVPSEPEPEPEPEAAFVPASAGLSSDKQLAPVSAPALVADEPPLIVPQRSRVSSKEDAAAALKTRELQARVSELEHSLADQKGYYEKKLADTSASIKTMMANARESGKAASQAEILLAVTEAEEKQRAYMEEQFNTRLARLEERYKNEKEQQHAMHEKKHGEAELNFKKVERQLTESLTLHQTRAKEKTELEVRVDEALAKASTADLRFENLKLENQDLKHKTMLNDEEGMRPTHAAVRDLEIQLQAGKSTVSQLQASQALERKHHTELMGEYKRRFANVLDERDQLLREVASFDEQLQEKEFEVLKKTRELAEREQAWSSAPSKDEVVNAAQSEYYVDKVTRRNHELSSKLDQEMLRHEAREVGLKQTVGALEKEVEALRKANDQNKIFFNRQEVSIKSKLEKITFLKMELDTTEREKRAKVASLEHTVGKQQATISALQGQVLVAERHGASRSLGTETMSAHSSSSFASSSVPMSASSSTSSVFLASAAVKRDGISSSSSYPSTFQLNWSGGSRPMMASLAEAKRKLDAMTLEAKGLIATHERNLESLTSMA